MAIKLILVCKEGPAKQAYLREASSIGIEVESVATFGDLFKAMITNAYHGVMIDLVTSVKASREEKGIAQEILDVFPLIQLRWDADTNSIHTISTGSTTPGNSLAHFVARECQLFQPRAVRLNVRKNIHFNVLIFRQEDGTQNHPEKSITVNISKNGCFLYSCQDWSGASDVWFVITELTDKTPIQGEIRWRQPWGKTMSIPGIGISITRILPQQLTQLIEQYSVA
jgi:hypothetical protein